MTAPTSPATTGPATTGYAPLGELEMYYEIHGSGGTPLVLLHGGLFNIDLQFGAVLPGLAAGRSSCSRPSPLPSSRQIAVAVKTSVGLEEPSGSRGPSPPTAANAILSGWSGTRESSVQRRLKKTRPISNRATSDWSRATL